jgi:hypothetical protein
LRVVGQSTVKADAGAGDAGERNAVPSKNWAGNTRRIDQALEETVLNHRVTAVLMFVWDFQVKVLFA